MRAGAALFADSQRSHRKIDIIVDDDQSLGVCFIERENLADTLTAEIHICLRLDENHFFPADKALSRQRFMFDFTDSDAQLFRQNIDGEKSHVMLCIFILLSRISETCDNIQRPSSFRNTIPDFTVKIVHLRFIFLFVSPDVLLFASA